MTPASKTGAVVIDANVLIAICAKEQGKFVKAENAFNSYVLQSWLFFAPGVIIAETLHILCQKLQNNLLTPAEHNIALRVFQPYMNNIASPPNGDATLIARAEALRHGYGCSRSADGLYIALAEELATLGAAELLTFDQGMINQAAKNAPTVKINLLAP